MLPNLKADVLGVISRDGDPRSALGPYVGTLGEAPVTWGFAVDAGENLLRLISSFQSKEAKWLVVAVAGLVVG